LLLTRMDSAIENQVTQVLTGAGFSIVGRAGDAGQALAMATDLRPDATLMDTTFPMSDRHLAPVVMMADNADPDLIRQARDAGVLGYVLGPFTTERLVPAIEMAVARHAVNTALRAQLTDLTERLDTRKVIERAKGLLMTRLRMTEPEAFRSIQRTAMDNRTSITAVAHTVIERLATAA